MNIEIVKLSLDESARRKGEPFKYNNKIYIWPEGESTIENLINRKSRPYKFYKENVIPLIMEKIKEQYPEHYTSLSFDTWRWSQKCGCSMCPCSPGFVGHKTGYRDIHATIKFS